MNKFANIYPHFKAISIKELPEGWIGKNHALQKGAELSSGDYLLFTDGDVLFKKEAILKAVQTCIKHNLDHLCLAPKLLSKGWLLASLNVFFGAFLLSVLRPSKIGRGKNFYAGIEAFNLVKRSAYQSIGEHKNLRLEIVDDVMLGKLLAFFGFSCAIAYGENLISLTWYKNIKEMIFGFEKNGFAASEYSVLLVTLSGFLMIYFFLLPFILVFFSPPLAKAGFSLSFFLMQSVLFEVARRLGYNPLISLLVPFSSWIVYFAQIRSAFMNLIQSKITWRNTHYSLKELKSHRRQLSHRFHK